MDILAVDSLMVLNSVGPVMAACELCRRNSDSEQCPYRITELQLLLLLQQLPIASVVQQLPIASVAHLIW